MPPRIGLVDWFFTCERDADLVNIFLELLFESFLRRFMDPPRILLV